MVLWQMASRATRRSSAVAENSGTPDNRARVDSISACMSGR